MPSRAHQIGLITAAAVLALVAVHPWSQGLSADRAPASAQAPLETRPGTAEAEPLLPSPLQTYRLTASELATVDHARGLLIDRCMQRFGLRYRQPPLTETLNAALRSEREALGRIYGITDPAAAATYGYGLPTPRTVGTTPPEASRSDTYLHVLRGDLATRQPGDSSTPGPAADDLPPVDGCAGEGRRRIGQADDTRSPYGLAHMLWIEGNRHLLASAGYAAVTRDWAGCMGRRGFHVTDPITDRGDIAAVFARRQAANDSGLDGAPVAGEVSLASADVACKRTVKLVDRLNALGARIDQRAISSNKRALERDRRRLDGQVELAAELLRVATADQPLSP